ncbi:MAG: TatD family hydrolase [bacterium]
MNKTDNNIQLIDTHAHLNMDHFQEDIQEVIEKSAASHLKYIIDIATDLASSRKVIRDCENYEMVFGAVGIHPHDSAQHTEQDLTELETLLIHPKIVALGETGLDYYYDYSPRPVQKKFFQAQLTLAAEVNIPVIIHIREAMKDGLEILQNLDTIPRGVFHCYSGTQQDLYKILDLGFYISFTGVVTFKNFKRQSVVAAVPLDRLLLETDAPFMTPVPYRGKRNDPSYVKYILKAVADTHNISESSLAQKTTANAENLFGL